MNVRSVEDCISATTDVVVGMMCDTTFHKEVLGLSQEQSFRLTGVSVRAIRETVTVGYGALQDTPVLSIEEQIHNIALRLSARTGYNLESCLETVNSVFRADHCVDLGPVCGEEERVLIDPQELREQMGVLF